MSSNSRCSNEAKTFFNLGKFYQDLSNVELSIGKRSNSRTNSPFLNKTNTINSTPTYNYQPKTNTNNYQPKNHLKKFQKQYQHKQKLHLQTHTSNLSKIKINSQQHKMAFHNYQSRISRPTYQQRFYNAESEYQSENFNLARDPSNTDLQRSHPNHIDQKGKYQEIKEKMENTFKNKNNKEKHENQENYVKIQTPKNENQITNQLIKELKIRNSCYTTAESYLSKKSYLKKDEDVKNLMQESFKEYKTMQKIIDHFKKICGLEMESLDELLSFLKEEKSQKDTSQDTLIKTVVFN